MTDNAWDELLALVDSQAQAIQRVRKLHTREIITSGKTGHPMETGFCGHCWSHNGEFEVLYPCPTIQALDGEQ